MATPVYQTTITFQIDSTTLVPGGATAATAVCVNHPTMLLQQTLYADKPNVAGDVPVGLAPGEYVRIYMAEAHGNLSVRIAPYAMLAATFPDANTAVEIGLLTSPELTPISIPNFEVDPDNMPYLSYVGGSPAWDTTEDQNYTYFRGVPEISQGLKASNAPIYAPHIQFQGSSNDPTVTGKLTYGLVFVVTRDGVKQEYFYFDPILWINSPSTYRKRS